MRKLMIVVALSSVITVLHATAEPSESQLVAADSAQAATRCAQAQPAVARLLDAATSRLESSRQTNSAAAMRAAVDEFQTVLRDLRLLLAPCAELQSTATTGHAGQHAMPGTPKVDSPAR
jgi:hypothetical protein